MKCAKHLVCFALATFGLLSTSKSSLAGSDILPSEYITGNDVVSMSSRNRVRRSPLHSAMKGAELVKKLLSSATQIDWNNKNIRVFKKFGTFKSAVNDFKALKPTSVENTRKDYQVSVVSGYVGNRFIVVERKGKMGQPTLTILNEQGGVYGQADTIIYTVNAPKFGSRRADDFVDRRKSDD